MRCCLVLSCLRTESTIVLPISLYLLLIFLLSRFTTAPRLWMTPTKRRRIFCCQIVAYNFSLVQWFLSFSYRHHHPMWLWYSCAVFCVPICYYLSPQFVLSSICLWVGIVDFFDDWQRLFSLLWLCYAIELIDRHIVAFVSHCSYSSWQIKLHCVFILYEL